MPGSQLKNGLALFQDHIRKGNEMKYDAPDFLERLATRDRTSVNATSLWLSSISWQLFVTVTFPWNVRDETANRKLSLFINSVEKFHRARICIVAGLESAPRRSGMSVPNHFHILMTSHAPLSDEAIEAFWLAQVTRRPSQGRNEESIRIEPFQPHLRGLLYCVKGMNTDRGGLFFHRLGDFLPGVLGPRRPTHRSIRNSKRNREQELHFRTQPGTDSVRIEEMPIEIGRSLQSLQRDVFSMDTLIPSPSSANATRAL